MRLFFLDFYVPLRAAILLPAGEYSVCFKEARLHLARDSKEKLWCVFGLTHHQESGPSVEGL